MPFQNSTLVRTLQVAAKLLFALDGFKKSLEVTFSKTAAAFTLDDFEKECGAGLQRDA